MTIADVITRVGDVLEGHPFRLTESEDAFDFEHQPPATVSNIYRIEAEMTGRQGYVGPVVNEQWSLGIWLARRAGSDTKAVRAQLLADISSLTVAIAADATDGEYGCGEDMEGEVPTPDAEQGYLVAHLPVGVEFDRAI